MFHIFLPYITIIRIILPLNICWRVQGTQAFLGNFVEIVEKWEKMLRVKIINKFGNCSGQRWNQRFSFFYRESLVYCIKVHSRSLLCNSPKVANSLKLYPLVELGNTYGPFYQESFTDVSRLRIAKENKWVNRRLFDSTYGCHFSTLCYVVEWNVIYPLYKVSNAITIKKVEANEEFTYLNVEIINSFVNIFVQLTL